MLNILPSNPAKPIKYTTQAKATVNQKGVKVADSPQTQGSVSVSFLPFKGFRIGADWVAEARTYSDFSLSRLDTQQRYCQCRRSLADSLGTAVRPFRFLQLQDCRCTRPSVWQRLQRVQQLLYHRRHDQYHFQRYMGKCLRCVLLIRPYLLHTYAHQLLIPTENYNYEK